MPAGPVARRVLFVVCSLVVGLVTTEAVVRVLGVGPELIRHEWRVPDPVVPYRLRPNYSYSGRIGSGEYEYSFQSNSFGYRDIEHAVDVPPSTYRILGIGDSFTEGWGADFEQSYLYLVERWLNDRPGEHPPVDVIKAGIGGFSPEAELALLRSEGLRFVPDLVIVGFTTNDVLDTYHGPKAVERNGLYRIGRVTARGLTRLEFGLYRWLRSSRPPLIRLSRWRSPIRSYEDLVAQSAIWNELWDEVLSIYDQMRLSIEASGARMVVLFMPGGPQGDTASDLPRLEAWSREHGILLIDTSDALSSAEASVEEVFWTVDPHPTARGYQRIAEELFEGLTAPGVLAAKRRIYYVSPQGSDREDGVSVDSAWQTLSRVNQAVLRPGTEIRFEGGGTFRGSLRIREGECGTVGSPVVLTTFGPGRAFIDAGDEAGISVENCGGFEISNLAVRGAPGSGHSGIEFRTDGSNGLKLEHIRIDNVEASEFRYGIRLVSTNDVSGYRDVRITNSDIHDNVRDGISTVGVAKTEEIGWAHEDVYVAHNTVYDNLGDPLYRETHSGNGIMISDVDGALIEHNLAYSNGGKNGNDGGGPVGIWAWDCNDVTIQFNESHSNHKSFRPKGADGDGFDLDGGCSNSVMQYNYAHDNDGAGFLVWQYSGARMKSNVTVRYNISVNDARKHGYGAITIGGEAMDGVDVYNNTVYLTRTRNWKGPYEGLENGIGIYARSEDVKNVRVFNNLIITDGGAYLVRLKGVGLDLVFAGNHYFTSGHPFRIKHRREKKDSKSLDEWRAALGQGPEEVTEFSATDDPLILNPGGRRAADYRLAPDSPLRDRALDLRLFGIDVGRQDFFGNALPQGARHDIGAHELGH